MTASHECLDVANRRFDRRSFLRGTVGVSTVGALLAAGCGSGSSEPKTPGATESATSSVVGTTPASTANPSGITPNLLTQEFVAGQDNRFSVGLISKDGKLVEGATVHLKFFTVGADGTTGTLRGEGDATYQKLDVPGAHEHDGSSGAAATDDVVPFYVAQTPFDVAGKWGVEISATLPSGGTAATIQAGFDVRDKPQSPGVGTKPPASKNDTFATNPDLGSLCSRTPACPLHDKVIADVLGKGRPLVVMFSTPAFCTSRFCGPVLEVLLEQVPAYQDKIDFVHIEVWQDFQLQKHRPATDEWMLPTEPYTFFMDKNGVVVGKFEAVFAQNEVKLALDQLVA